MCELDMQEPDWVKIASDEYMRKKEKEVKRHTCKVCRVAKAEDDGMKPCWYCTEMICANCLETDPSEFPHFLCEECKTELLTIIKYRPGTVNTLNSGELVENPCDVESLRKRFPNGARVLGEPPKIVKKVVDWFK